MNPSALFPEALKEVIRSAAGSCCLYSIPFNQTTTRWSGGRRPCAKIEGLPYLSVIHSRAASVACPRPWSLRVQLPDRARVTVLLAAETNEKALCVFILRKSRYFVLIEPMKAELESRRETTI